MEESHGEPEPLAVALRQGEVRPASGVLLQAELPDGARHGGVADAAQACRRAQVLEYGESGVGRRGIDEVADAVPRPAAARRTGVLSRRRGRTMAWIMPSSMRIVVVCRRGSGQESVDPAGADSQVEAVDASTSR